MTTSTCTRVPSCEGAARRAVDIACEAVDRHAHGPESDRVALRYTAKDGAVRDVTYRALAERTSRFANVLRLLGVRRGDRVCVLANRIPELYVACVGTLKNGSVFCPVSSALESERIAERIGTREGKVLVTTRELYETKVARIRDALPSLRYVLLVDPSGARTTVPGTLDLGTLLELASRDIEIQPASWNDAGSTADLGSLTDATYGIIAPLVDGVTSIMDETELDPGAC